MNHSMESGETFDQSRPYSEQKRQAVPVCGDEDSLRQAELIGTTSQCVMGVLQYLCLLLHFSGSPGINTGISPHVALYAVIKVHFSFAEDTEECPIIYLNPGVVREFFFRWHI